MDKSKEILTSIYYNVNNPASFAGKTQLFKAAKKLYPKIDRKFVENWIQNEDTYNLFKPRKRKFPRLPIIVERIDEQWQADLLDMSWFSTHNDRTKFILVAIDCLSRYAWAIPIKDKSANSVLDAFKKIFSQGRKPKKLQTDQGKEFVNSTLKKFLHENNVHFFTSTNDDIKCAIVERFNRTLRSRIYRYLFYKNTHKYVDVLQKIVKGYNDSFHRALQMAPSEVNEQNYLKARANVRKAYKIKPHHKKPVAEGKTVRISRKKELFEKGATANWTEELFKVEKRKKTPINYIYKLVDLDGEPITSIFYPEEINPVEEKELYKIEKILKKRKNPRTKKTEYFVKWLGYPAKFNSWVTNIEK